MPVKHAQYDALVKLFEDAGKNAPGEIKQALSTSQRTAKTEFPRAVQSAFNVKSGAVKRKLSISPVDTSRLSYVVSADPGGITVAAFGARQNKKGLTVQEAKSRPRRVIAGGFFPRSGNKSKVPFKRFGKARFPLEVQYGPSAAEMLASKAVQEPSLKNTKIRLFSDIETRITRLVRRG